MVLPLSSSYTKGENKTEICLHGSAQNIYQAWKKMHILCGGHGLVLWSLFGYFPLWFQTYRTLPDKKNKNLIVIANRFNLDIDTQEQADGLVSSISIGLSNAQKMPMDNTCVEHETYKYGRFLHQNSEKWYT